MSRLQKPSSTAYENQSHLFMKVSAILMMGIFFGMAFFNAALPWITPKTIELSNRPFLLRFSSYWELKTFLNNSATWGPYYYVNLRGQPVIFAATESKGAAVDYSQTNIQVEGVDEADIVKTDGEYIYLASNAKVIIVKAYPPDEAGVVAEISLNGTVMGLYVNGNRLVIFESQWQEYSVRRLEVVPYYWPLTTNIKVYDVADRANPFLVRNVTSDGGYFASRMIGDYVYILVSRPAYIQEGEVILPVITEDGRVQVVSPSKIYYANVTDYYYEFTTIIAVNTQNDAVEPVSETFLLGAGRGIYVSLNNIYLAIPRYDLEEGFETTEIHKFRIEANSIKSEGSGVVPGYILNQFSMDEHEGNFRIATTTGRVSGMIGEPSSSNNIYVLDANLTIVGRLENLAPGESIYSARFMGQRCYLVTFKKIDPLFVISLEDPANPRVLGKLKIPGYSDYLHPYSENLLIGIGKETVEAEEGDFAWYQGVKIALFDVSDVENPKEIAKYVIGDRGTDSPVLWDHKAFLFDKERNLLAFPVLVAEIDEAQYPEGVPPFAYGDFVWQGVYIFNITETSITFRGGVTHMSNMDEMLKSGFYFYSEYSVERALYIEDFLYSISQKKIKINDLATLQEVNEVELP